MLPRTNMSLSNGGFDRLQPTCPEPTFCAPVPALAVGVKLSCVEKLTASAGVPKSTTPVSPALMIQDPRRRPSPSRPRTARASAASR
jgi:hypothetical protein